jgi:hypothetical protein
MMPSIKKFYENVRKYGEELYYDWEEKIYEAALNCPEVKVELRHLFEIESDLDYKIDLAKILAQLGEQIIVPYIYEHFATFDLDNKWDATKALIYLNDNRAFEFFDKTYHLYQQCTDYENKHYPTMMHYDLEHIPNETAYKILKIYYGK